MPLHTTGLEQRGPCGCSCDCPNQGTWRTTIFMYLCDTCHSYKMRSRHQRPNPDALAGSGEEG